MLALIYRQFCYLCGSPWKTCGCEQWQQQNLLRGQQEMDHAFEHMRIEDDWMGDINQLIPPGRDWLALPLVVRQGRQARPDHFIQAVSIYGILPRQLCLFFELTRMSFIFMHTRSPFQLEIYVHLQMLTTK